MKRFIYRTCLVLILGMTALSGYGCVEGINQAQQVVDQTEPHLRSAAQAGMGIGMMVNLFVWAVVVVPLGVIGLLAKPSN